MTKSEFVACRLIPNEHEALLKIGQDRKLNISETIRFLIREKAQSSGIWQAESKEETERVKLCPTS